jgi:serine phosphatase RsbU (regulator of sigma subunit)
MHCPRTISTFYRSCLALLAGWLYMSGPAMAQGDTIHIDTSLEYEQMINKGDAYYSRASFDSAAAYYQGAFDHATPSATNAFLQLYNAACCYSLAGHTSQAVTTLLSAIDHGYLDDQLIRTDKDLDHARTDPRWSEVETRINQALSEKRSAYMWGALFGIELILCLYNLLLFFILRDRAYLFYSIFIIFGILTQVFLTKAYGMLLALFIPVFKLFAPLFNEFIFNLSLMMLFYTLFVGHFLELKKNFPKLAKVLTVLCIYFGLNALVSAYNFHMPRILFSPYPVGIAVLTIFIISIYTYVKGYRPAKYFVLANTALTLGFLLSILSSLKFIEKYFIIGVFTPDQIGLVAFQLLLSLALGDRINILKAETITAQEKALVVLEEKVQERTAEVVRQKQEIEVKSQEITDSINYAKRIQQSILPPLEEIAAALPRAFILFKPKDIVSGDFYWFMRRQDGVFLAAADCTGHGVPGSFMSMLGSEKLNEAAGQSGRVEEMLQLVNRSIKKALRQSEKEDSTRDGMDIALVNLTVSEDGAALHYAGANRPLWIIRNGALEIEETKATKVALGGLTPDEQEFRLHRFDLKKGDSFYIFSDGYADQFSPDDKKLMTRKFKEILLSIQDKDMDEQKRFLGRHIESWKGNMEQTDDILVIGVRI